MKTTARQQEPFESAIYRGQVTHIRHRPSLHSFRYPYFMLLLKANEIPRVLESFWQLGSGPLSWGRFKRSDYLGEPRQGIDQAVKQKMAELMPQSADPATEPDGDVFLLGHLRYFGFYFSPLNLYFLRQDGVFTWMLAEVSNTPWLEKHYYLVDLSKQADCNKAFHVSPFNPMDQRYRWRITPPDSCGRCSVSLSSFDKPGTEAADAKEGDLPQPVFEAAMSLRRVPLNQTELRRVLIRSPAQTLSLVLGIYWQALRLFLKRTPLYPHPKKNTDPNIWKPT